MKTRLSAPTDIEKEGERLAEKWLADDEGLSLNDYLKKHSSEKALTFMRECEEAQELIK